MPSFEYCTKISRGTSMLIHVLVVKFPDGGFMGLGIQKILHPGKTLIKGVSDPAYGIIFG